MLWTRQAITIRAAAIRVLSKRQNHTSPGASHSSSPQTLTHASPADALDAMQYIATTRRAHRFFLPESDIDPKQWSDGTPRATKIQIREAPMLDAIACVVLGSDNDGRSCY